MSTPEISLQLDNFLEKKGLLGTENPNVGPPAPTIQQSLNSSLDSFLKYKGYQIPGDLPNEKPPQATPEMKAYVEKEFAPTNVQPSFVSTPPAKEGELPKIEMTPGPTPAFWQQAKDLAVAWAKGKIGPEDLVGVDFFKGLTLGNIDPYAIVEKISGKPGFKQMAETATRARIKSAVGYEPTQAVAFVGGASQSMGQLAALTPILKGAGVAARVLPKIPMLRAVARGVVAGTLTGAIQKPDEEGVWNRLKQIPPNVLFFTAFETLGVTAEQMLKIFKWNKEFGGVKPGATVDYVSKEVPGEATAFSADEMKELFRKMNANAAGTGGEWSRVTAREQEVINVASKSPGWKQAVKEGFFQEGVPQTVYGAKVTPDLIPRKPQMGDLFRNEANLPKYQPTGEAQELWPSKWPREEGKPSPVEPPIPGRATAGPTVTAEGAKVPVGKTTINIRPQADGSIKVDVEPSQAQPRIGPTGEVLGEFEGAGYQGADKEAVKAQYEAMLRGRVKATPPATMPEFGAERPVAQETAVPPSAPTGEHRTAQGATLRKQIDVVKDKIANKTATPEDIKFMEDAIYTDSATGLKNRRAWSEEIGPDNPQIVVDMNDLKKLNDEQGHEAGNKALDRIAQEMRRLGLNSYRYGGDEFVISGDVAQIGTGIIKLQKVLSDMGIDVSYGVGKNFFEADRGMYKMKGEMKAVAKGPAKQPLGEPSGIPAPKPAWWNEPSANAFAKGMTEGEVITDWFNRHRVPQENGQYVLYHATPERVGATTNIRSGSYLAEDSATAIQQATRERGPKAGPIKVIKVLVNPEDIRTGVWATLREDYNLAKSAQTAEPSGIPEAKPAQQPKSTPTPKVPAPAKQLWAGPLYHGTKSNFASFGTPLVHLTTDPARARHYSMGDVPGRVLSVKASITNPLVVREAPYEIKAKRWKEIQEQGYDAIVFDLGSGRQDVVVSNTQTSILATGSGDIGTSTKVPVSSGARNDIPDLAKPAPIIEELPPGEAINIRKDALAKAKAEIEYAKNLRAGTIERTPKPEVPAVEFTDAEKAKISKDITYLTSGSKTPRIWREHPEQIEANRNELIKQALLKLPAATPEEIKTFVNKYAPNIQGDVLQTRKQQAISKEMSYPRIKKDQPGEGGGIDFAEMVTKDMLPSAERGPKGKPPASPRLASERAKDIFTSEQEEVRVLDTLSKAAGGDEKILEILKSKLLADVPETDLALSQRIGVPKSSVSYHYRKALAKLKDSEEIKDIMKRHFVQLNVGPLPSKEQLRKMAKFANKFFTSTKGVDRTIDRQNDERLGSIAAEAFEQTLNIGKLFKWVKHQDTPGLEGYLTDLVTGAMSGDGYTDIANSNLPSDIKAVLTAFRTRTDALSDMITTEADVTGATKEAFDTNMGKYLHKYYRLYEDKAWSPSDQQKAGFKQHLMQTYGMTADEAEASMEADLAYARNDELLKPKHSRNTKAVPAGSFIKRKALSPEWRSFAGEIDRATWLMIKTTTDQAVTAYNAKFLSFLSDYLSDLWTADADLAKKRGWQHSQLPGTYRYGKLRNKYVSPELQQYISREFDISTSGMEKAIQKFLITPYKWTKTIGSYPGHMRNLMGNTAFSILARCSIFDPLNYGYYARSVKAHINRGKIGPDADLWKSLIKDGITETQYWGSEIPRLYNEMLQFEPSTWLERLIDKTIKWPIDKLGELYNFGDSVYRVAAHFKNTEHYHMTPSESSEEINITFQNYRKLPVAVDFLRKYPVLGPFVSFTWNLGKIVGAQATKGVKEIKSPATRLRGLHRLFLLLGVAMLPEIASEISKKLNHFDGKQVDELEKFYTSYRRGGSFLYFRGENGEPRIFDMSYIWPIGNLTRPLKGLLSGDTKGMLDALSFMNAPAIDAYQILVKGKDPQWGQDYPGFFDKVKAFARLFYLPASSPIPSLPALLKGDIRPGTLTGPQFKAIIDAYNKQPYGKLQYEREFPTEIKNFVTGIRTWKLDPEKVLAQYIGSKRAEAQAEQSRFTTWMRDNWKAKDWEIKKKSDATAEHIKKALADAEKAARLLHDLKRDGFKITDKQDYNFRKENE